jgi:hypothetical protein
MAQRSRGRPITKRVSEDEAEKQMLAYDQSLREAKESSSFQQPAIKSIEDWIINAVEPYLRANYEKEFNAVLKAGVNSRDLLISLCRYVSLDKMAKDAKQSARGRRHCESALHKTDKQRKTFPTRLSGIAAECEVYNVGTIALGTPDRMLQAYRLLPKLLAKYAAFQEQQFDSELGPAAFISKATQELETLVTRIIKPQAHRPMLREVACLIHGTKDALTIEYSFSKSGFKLSGPSSHRTEPVLSVAAIKSRLRRRR